MQTPSSSRERHDLAQTQILEILTDLVMPEVVRRLEQQRLAVAPAPRGGSGFARGFLRGREAGGGYCPPMRLWR